MVLLIAAIFGICTSYLNHKAYGELVQVWIGDAQSARGMETPKAFTISPWEAYQIVAESVWISLKHKSICYRDEQYCYIADPFGKNNSAETAVRYGLKINGASGKIEN